MFSRPCRTPLHRSIAVAVITAIVALTIPAAPADAAGGMVAIDPLQTATRIESLSTRTLIAADLSKNVGAGAPILDNQIVKPALPPIAFKPFPIVDPKASPGVAAPISRDATIVTPGGKTVNAGAYWDEINAVEKDLNGRGQSLRNGTKFNLGRLAGSSQTEMLATRLRNPQIKGTTISVNGKAPGTKAIVALLDRTPLSETAPVPLDTGTAPAINTFINSTPIPALTKAKGIPTPSPTPSPTPKPTASPEPPPDTLPLGYKDEHRKPLSPLPAEHDTLDLSDLTYSKSYTESEGSKGSAEFYLKADLASTTDKAGDQNFTGKVATGAYILGGGGDVASASASLQGTTASVDIEAVGSTLYKKDGTLKPGGTFADSTSQSDTFISFSVPIQVSYFVVTFAASVTGSAGVNFTMDNFNIIGGGIAFSVAPFLSIAGSFSVSVGVGIADIISVSVGVQGNLTIASITLPLIGSTAYTINVFYTGTGKNVPNIYACRSQFNYDLRAELSYQFLSGSVGVFLQGCFIFCATIFSITLFSWNGFTGNDTLFHVGGHAAVGPVYSDLAEYGYHDSNKSALFSPDGKDGRPKACRDFYDRFAPGLL